MASITDITEITYHIGSDVYTKEEIISKYSQIQSAHDKSKSRDFTEEEIAIKGFYKSIQSQRDSARIRDAKLSRDQEPSTQYQFGGREFSTEEIVQRHSQIQSAHARNASLEFSEEELQIEKWYKLIQSSRDSERIRERNKERVHTTTPMPEARSKLIRETWYTDEMICKEHSAIQSLHDKDKSLVYNEHELEIKNHYKEIQSRRDSERIRVMRGQPSAYSDVASDIAEYDTAEHSDNFEDGLQTLIAEMSIMQPEELLRFMSTFQRMRENFKVINTIEMRV